MRKLNISNVFAKLQKPVDSLVASIWYSAFYDRWLDLSAFAYKHLEIDFDSEFKVKNALAVIGRLTQSGKLEEARNLAAALEFFFDESGLYDRYVPRVDCILADLAFNLEDDAEALCRYERLASNSEGEFAPCIFYLRRLRVISHRSPHLMQDPEMSDILMQRRIVDHCRRFLADYNLTLKSERRTLAQMTESSFEQGSCS